MNRSAEVERKASAKGPKKKKKRTETNITGDISYLQQCGTHVDSSQIKAIERKEIETNERCRLKQWYTELSVGAFMGAILAFELCDNARNHSRMHEEAKRAGHYLRNGFPQIQNKREWVKWCARSHHAAIEGWSDKQAYSFCSVFHLFIFFLFCLVCKPRKKKRVRHGWAQQSIETAIMRARVAKFFAQLWLFFLCHDSASAKRIFRRNSFRV